MITKRTPQIAEQAIKEMIQKGKDYSHYVRSMINCWDIDGFDSKHEAKISYSNYITSIKIRRYCRKNKHSTARGEYQGYNCQVEAKELWNIVDGTGMTGEYNGMRWEYRYVDQLKNVRVWF